ncbi:hypothetical protein T10_10239 [Trichinella papuae]|uniref:Uncharacterized protein n=1 Tax=Trichinella papuae TaxID=268474 RepID=A0A0V1MWR0_9BILA|nr:hypothetical protein T10_10239 [Trichinella papuae]
MFIVLVLQSSLSSSSNSSHILFCSSFPSLVPPLTFPILPPVHARVCLLFTQCVINLLIVMEKYANHTTQPDKAKTEQHIFPDRINQIDLTKLLLHAIYFYREILYEKKNTAYLV